MAGHTRSTASRAAWRKAAVALLGGEVALWILSFAIFVGSGVEGLVVIAVMAIFALLSAVTIVFLGGSPAAAGCLGLGLQGLLALFGFALTFVFASLIGIVDVVIASTTAICIAQAVSARVVRD